MKILIKSEKIVVNTILSSIKAIIKTSNNTLHIHALSNYYKRKTRMIGFTKNYINLLKGLMKNKKKVYDNLWKNHLSKALIDDIYYVTPHIPHYRLKIFNDDDELPILI